MRLGIDAREIQTGVYTGIGRALMHFLRYFDTTLHQDRCVLFSSKPLPFRFGDRIENRVIGEAPTLWWDQVLLPAVIGSEDVEIFFSPYYKLPLAAKCRKVSAVLDVMYVKHPPYINAHSWIRKIYYATMGKVYLHNADRIMTSSEYSKNDMMDAYAVNARRIAVIPLGVSQVFRPLDGTEDVNKIKSEFGISGQYLLYVGNFKPHKNVPTLVKAFALLSFTMPDISLVLVAPRKGSDEVMSLIRQLNIEKKVILTDIITDEMKLKFLYAGAEVFVFPSLYEGFGIPPVEAMACGTPVICADATCLPETCAGAGVLVDPLSVESYVNALTRIMTNSKYRKGLRRKGLDRAELIREDKFGRRLYELFRSAAEHV